MPLLRAGEDHGEGGDGVLLGHPLRFLQLFRPAGPGQHVSEIMKYDNEIMDQLSATRQELQEQQTALEATRRSSRPRRRTWRPAGRT